MDNEIDRFEAFTRSSLRKCRQPLFSLHFRAELPSFNVIGSGSGPNPVALKFKCKNNISKKSASPSKATIKTTSYSSIWKIRHPEMRPGGQIAVPIAYDGDWSRISVISLVFMIQNKKKQRVAYSKGEILLVDDVLEDRFTILMTPRDEKSCEDLKVPVMVHLLMDVWNIDAGDVKIRCAQNFEVGNGEKMIVGVENAEEGCLVFQRIDSPRKMSDECTWPESTDFLIEIPLQSSRKNSCDCKNCDGRCAFDENANLVEHAKFENSIEPNQSIQFFCHQSKLAKESKVFEEMFDGEWTREANVLKVRSLTPKAVEMFLNFIYTDRLYSVDSPEHGDGISRIDFDEIIQVVSLANRYEVERLRAYCDSLLTDRYLNLTCAAETILIADRYELPLLGQAALSLLSWALDEEYWQPVVTMEGKHLLSAVVREARRKHMGCNVINPCSLKEFY